MAEEEPIIKIPKKNHESLFPTGPLSKSVPTSFYSRREPPPAPRHRPLRSKEDPESFQLPPPSPLDDHKIKENLLLGRSLTKTTPAQLLYPSSVPSRFPAKRLRDLSLTPKKPDILQDDLEASPSSSVHSTKEDTEHDEPKFGSQPIGSLSSTLYQILEGDALHSNSRDPVSVLTDAHDPDEDDRDDMRNDGIFELEDD
jgi:hypothetical protein